MRGSANRGITIHFAKSYLPNTGGKSPTGAKVQVSSFKRHSWGFKTDSTHDCVLGISVNFHTKVFCPRMRILFVCSEGFSIGLHLIISTWLGEDWHGEDR